MIHIRELTQTDMRQAMELKVSCWPEEVAGLSDETPGIGQELEFWTDWMHTATEHSDVRLLIGAFEDEEMLGVAFGSFAEPEDIVKNGIELNGLWVCPQHRGRGLSLMLVMHILDYYSALGMDQIVIYNMHHSPSNTFYRKFGCRVMRMDVQMKENVPVDVFISSISEMKEVMNRSLERYRNNHDQLE